MAPAPRARPPRSHLVRFFIRGGLFAKWIEPGGNGWQSTQRTLGIYWRVAGPFGRHVILCEDSLHWTFRNTCVAIDTRFGIDHEHVVVEMKRLNRTNKRTIGVATVNARLSHDVGHWNFDSLKRIRIS